LGILKLLNDGGANGGYGIDYRRKVQHSYVPIFVRIGFVRPSVNTVGLGMVVQVEDLDNPVPDCLAVPRLFNRHAFDVRGVGAVQFVDYLAKVV
jgi:hypothetical protein